MFHPTGKFLVACFFVFELAMAGGSVNNGGGLAEQNFYLAYFKLDSIYQRCLEASDCLRDPDSRQIIAQLLQDLPKERQTHDPIQFNADDSETISTTGPNIGDVIFINRSYIYRTTQDGQEIPLDPEEAVGILTEQLLVHQGIQDKSYRVYLAKSVETFCSVNKFNFF